MPSHLEQEFMRQLHELGPSWIPELERRVIPGRRWRYDFAWPRIKLAVEIEGGSPEAGHHHHNRKGFLNDCRKYNTAVGMGWRVLRFTGAQVKSGEAFKWTKFTIEGKVIPDGRREEVDDSRGATRKARRPKGAAGREGRVQEERAHQEPAVGAVRVHEGGPRRRRVGDQRVHPEARP